MVWGKLTVSGEEDSQKAGTQHSSDNKSSTEQADSCGVRSFFFLVILLQIAPPPRLNILLLFLTGIFFPRFVQWAAILSIFTSSRWWIIRVCQFSVVGGWLFPLSSYCLDASCCSGSKVLMSSISYIEQIIHQGRYVWASIPATYANQRAGTGREEYRDEVKKVALGFGDLESELWSGMPDEILEKIFARLPLKKVMQVCLLSHSWAHKVSSLSFQAEVCRYSANWRSLCPLHYSDSSLKLRGFDRSAMEWQDALSLSYLPDHVRKDCVLKFRPIAHNDTRRSFQSVAGSLLCFLQVDADASNNLVIHMTNPMNRSLKKLPPVVKVRPSQLYSVKVVPVGFYGYRVIVLELDTMHPERVSSDSDRYPIRVFVYDSWLESWTPKRAFSSLPTKWCCRSIEYFQGSIYMLYQDCQQSHGELSRAERVSDNVLKLGVYDVESEKWRQVSLPVRYPYSFSNSSLCVCGSSLLMVAIEEFFLPVIEYDGNRVSMGSIRKNSIRISKLDLDTQQFKEICRGPSEDIEKEYLSGKFYHDEESIFFSALGNTTVVAYNVCRQVWLTQPILGDERSKYNTYYGFLQHAYQPGLNPFVIA